jgi:4-amino-4-deoxy-L-arabinose transferase-like glycosyltransferase
MTGRRQTLPMRHRIAQIGLAIYVLALALRFAVLLEVRDHPTIAQCSVLDMRGNHEFARAILAGLRPTTYYKAPFYTYLMAGIYAVGGPEPFNVRVVQVVLVSFIPVLALLIAHRFFGLLVGTISGVLTAIYWTFLYFSVELLDTELACLVYMLLAYLLLVLDDRRWLKWLTCGALLGWGAIIRPNILAFAPVLAAAVLVVGWRREFVWSNQAANRGRDRWRRAFGTPVAHAAFLTVGCCAVIAPVTLRNRLLGGEWVLIGAYGGMNFYVANSPYSDSKDGPLLIDESACPEPTTWDPNEPWARCCLNYYTAVRVAEAELGRRPTPGEFSSILGRRGLDFLKDHPGWLARHAVRRLCWLFNTHEFHSNRDLYHFRKWSHVLTVASVLQFGMICPFALVGLAMALGRRDLHTAEMAYYVSMLASLALPAVLFIINARFRLPMVHLLMPFAAYGLVEFIRLVKPAVTWRKRVVVGAAVVGLGVFCNLNVFDYWNSSKAHLRWAMVIACDKAGRTDLVGQAVKEFEQALAKDLKDLRPSNTALVLKYASPMTWLFSYYDRQQNRDKALEYARRMLRDEPFAREPVLRAFELFMAVGDRRGALAAIEAMNRRVGPYVLGECLSRYGQTFEDRPALIRAKELYENAIQAYPTELRYHRALSELRTRLDGTANITTRAASTPSTSSSPARRGR